VDYFKVLFRKDGGESFYTYNHFTFHSGNLGVRGSSKCNLGNVQCTTVWDSDPRRGRGTFPSPSRPDRIWGPSNLLANWYRGIFSWDEAADY
jgi:hypothetical protein